VGDKEELVSAGKMHADEVDIDAALVRRLVAAQFPQWTDLPLEPVQSAGTDNAIYRLGDELAVRLPRIPSATGQVEKDGRLSGVVDFDILGIGDPACELTVGWSLFSAETREVFRVALAVDDATWARGRGWALSVALIALPYYETTNPVMVANARHRIDEVLADQEAQAS
jgi:aminoglycoside phosphotransferase (APT) family kinase protein